jgi:hypothetical protein
MGAGDRGGASIGQNDVSEHAKPEFRRRVQHPSPLSLLDFPFLGAAFASRNAAEGGGKGRKIRFFLGGPERPKVSHFASESTKGECEGILT